MTANKLITVVNGEKNKNTIWITQTNVIVLGVTPIKFMKFNAMWQSVWISILNENKLWLSLTNSIENLNIPLVTENNAGILCSDDYIKFKEMLNTNSIKNRWINKPVIQRDINIQQLNFNLMTNNDDWILNFNNTEQIIYAHTNNSTAGNASLITKSDYNYLMKNVDKIVTKLDIFNNLNDLQDKQQAINNLTNVNNDNYKENYVLTKINNNVVFSQIPNVDLYLLSWMTTINIKSNGNSVSLKTHNNSDYTDARLLTKYDYIQLMDNLGAMKPIKFWTPGNILVWNNDGVMSDSCKQFTTVIGETDNKIPTELAVKNHVNDIVIKSVKMLLKQINNTSVFVKYIILKNIVFSSNTDSSITTSLSTIDDNNLIQGDVVCLNGQINKNLNGVYTVSLLNPTVLEKKIINDNVLLSVSSGLYLGTLWKCNIENNNNIEETSFVQLTQQANFMKKFSPNIILTWNNDGVISDSSKQFTTVIGNSDNKIPSELAVNKFVSAEINKLQRQFYNKSIFVKYIFLKNIVYLSSNTTAIISNLSCFYNDELQVNDIVCLNGQINKKLNGVYIVIWLNPTVFQKNKFNDNDYLSVSSGSFFGTLWKCNIDNDDVIFTQLTQQIVIPEKSNVFNVHNLNDINNYEEGRLLSKNDYVNIIYDIKKIYDTISVIEEQILTIEKEQEQQR